MSDALKITLEDVAAFMRDQIKRSTEDQGHKLTGRLSASTVSKVTRLPDGYYADVLREAYGEAIENGVDRTKIPFSPGSGAKHSQYIEGLLEFVRRRNLKPERGQTQLGIAFAIAHAQKRTGLPTVASRRFSKSGRRTGAVAEAANKNKRYITGEIDKGGEQYLQEVARELIHEATNSPFIEITLEL